MCKQFLFTADQAISFFLCRLAAMFPFFLYQTGVLWIFLRFSHTFYILPSKTAYITRRHQETISWCLFVCRNNLVKENKRPLSGKNMECIGGDFILDQKTPERNMQHYLWLSYFNRTLRDQGVITMDEYRKMNHLIWTKYPVSQKA